MKSKTSRRNKDFKGCGLLEGVRNTKNLLVIESGYSPGSVLVNMSKHVKIARKGTILTIQLWVGCLLDHVYRKPLYNAN